jgi:hypothetical protein
MIGVQDAFVMQLDSNGQEVWTKMIGSEESDIATSVTIDGENKVVVVGSSNGILKSGHAKVSN